MTAVLMPKFFVRIEGVNFTHTLTDTDNLSVVRGASRLYADVASVLRPVLEKVAGGKWREEASGASVVLLQVEGDDDLRPVVEREIRAVLGQAPWKHLSFVVDIAPTAEGVEARNRSRQFRQWTVPPCPAVDATRQCWWDHVRGATTIDHGKPLSAATSARLDHGRRQRSEIIPGDPALGHCDSFADLIDGAPPSVPDSARRKVAVIHLDGDGFGSIARTVGAQRFSCAMEQKLSGLLGRLNQEALTAEKEHSVTALRFRIEPLVWGGDDITLVVPAWRALSCLGAIMDEVRTWTIDGEPLTFTGGAIIAHHKSPVRRLVTLADEAVQIAKDADLRGSFSIDVFESLEPPEDGLEGHRAQVFGGDVMPRDLAFPGDQARDVADRLAEWRERAGES